MLTESERLNLKSLNQSKINQNNDGMEPDKTGFGCLGGNTVKNYFRNLALFKGGGNAIFYWAWSYEVI